MINRFLVQGSLGKNIFEEATYDFVNDKISINVDYQTIINRLTNLDNNIDLITALANILYLNRQELNTDISTINRDLTNIFHQNFSFTAANGGLHINLNTNGYYQHIINDSDISSSEDQNILKKMGTDHGDIIQGSNFGDYIFAKDGDDIVHGGYQDDYIDGGNNNDVISGKAGNDWLIGGKGNDIIFGDDGNDIIYGGSGNDKIGGNAGNDIIDGGSGIDEINGDEGADNIEGQDGNDIIFGGNGDDKITGDEGDDLIKGEEGDDVINGNTGNDIIYGDDGNDIIKGDSGNDLIIGGLGVDVLSGGSGKDIFIFTSLNDSNINASDLIKDFKVEEDKINLSDLGFFNIIEDDGASAIGDTNTLHYCYDRHSNTTIISNDNNNFAIKLSGNIHLDYSDFIL